MDHRVQKDQRLEESRVDQGKIGELGTTHAMAHANDGSGHLLSERIDHVEKIAAVIEPGR